MGSKNRRESVPQPGNPQPPGIAQGGKAFNALSNHTQVNQTSGGGTGTVTAGSLYATAPTITPKVSGKVLVIWSTAGAGANATGGGTFTPTLGSFTGPLMSAQVGGGTAGGGTINTGGSFIATGLTVGTPASFNVAYTSASGYTQATDGGVTLIELPG